MKVEVYLDERHHVLNLRGPLMQNIASIKLTAQAEALIKRSLEAAARGEDPNCFLVATGTEFTAFGTKDFAQL